MGVLASNDHWPGFSSALAQHEFDGFREIVARHIHTNGWFTAENIFKALREWSMALREENLDQWLDAYVIPENISPKKIGIICAGNIPMVGFHDVMSVLISGHHALIKLSSGDDFVVSGEPGLKFYQHLQQ